MLWYGNRNVQVAHNVFTILLCNSAQFCNPDCNRASMLSGLRGQLTTLRKNEYGIHTIHVYTWQLFLSDFNLVMTWISANNAGNNPVTCKNF